MSTSRIDLSGARISRRSVLPSGCTKPKTVTSFGTSWAVIRGARRGEQDRPPRPIGSITCWLLRRSTRLSVPSILAPAKGRRRCVAGGSIALAQPRLGGRGEPRVKKNRKLFTGAAFVAVLATLGVVQGYLDKVAAQAKQVPRFEVDPFWPKPMPNNYVFGQTIGLGISSDDHVWIIHRGNDPGNLDRTELCACRRPTWPARQRVLQCRRRRSWSSMRPATTSAAGAARSPARRISGPRATTASSSITRASCGSAATASPTRTS